MDWKQRAIDCRRRAEVVHPFMVKACNKCHKLDRVWSYWANRAVEAQMKVIEVKVIDPQVTRKSIDKAKKDFGKLMKQLTPKQAEDFIAALKGEMKDERSTV